MPQKLFDRLEDAGKLPTPPGVVLRLLEITRREDVSAREIADTLGQDPALAAKVLRFANSPMAGVPREVSSLQQAVALMGIRGVKMTALSFAVLGSGGQKSCQGFDEQQYAVQAIGCGVAAKLLASEADVGSPQDAFLAGLLSQIGRVVLATAAPEEYSAVLARAQQIPGDLPSLETAVWGEAYSSIGAQLLRSWGIPENLCAAIGQFREVDGEQEAEPLAKVLCVAEIAAGVVCPDAKSDPLGVPAFVAAAGDILEIESEQSAGLLNEIAQEIENTRTTLEMPKGKMRSPDDIQNDVRERIAEMSLAMHLENQSMVQRQEDLMRKATTDALTGVGNRVAFDSRLELELERCARSRNPFALLMLDVDKFKSFNDTYGHQAGDCVLRTVAQTLDSNVRKVDYVARYGGEEFAVIAPDSSMEGVSILAERLRRAVEETSVPWEGNDLNVTISIGVAVFREAIDGGDASKVIKVADAQLYAAKRGGRNRVEIAVDGTPMESVEA